MKDILDVSNYWKGTPIGASFSSVNKAPIAVDDDRTVLQDSGTVVFAALANDVDPEGQPLTLISANAALGTAVANPDNTVSYTPPPGISGFDTVVYEVADDLDQRSTGQINITITEPALVINTLSDNTLVITAGTGPLDLSVSAPAEFAGTYPIDTADLIGGPINLAPPVANGTVSAGQVLSATGGLWVKDTDSGPVQRIWQWRRSGGDIPGANGISYTVQAADVGTALSVRETLNDANGQRSSESASIGGSAGSFTPSDDIGVLSWHDAADVSTITGASSVSLWADKASGGADFEQTFPAYQPLTGTRSLNGLNVLDFAGNDYFEKALSLPASGDLALHMAVILDGTSSQYAAVVAFEASNDMQLDAASDTQFDGRLNVAGIGSSISLSGGPFSGAVIMSVVFDQTGSGTAEVFVGNVSRGSGAYTTPLDATTAFHLMTNRSKNAEVDGAVCEVVITNDITSRTAYYDYLSAKWGIS